VKTQHDALSMARETQSEIASRRKRQSAMEDDQMTTVRDRVTWENLW